MSTKVMHPISINEETIKMKLAGKTTKEIMLILNIKNESQVKNWWRWYRRRETYRFHQGGGKQYTYQKGISELSEIEQLKITLRQKELELDVLKKYKELERM